MTDDDASPPSVNLELPERHLMTQGPPSHAIMSISTRTDISPTSSGSSNYPRTVADQVGGCGLTLTIVLSCGMATRNLGVALAPLFSLAEVDQQAIVMVVLGLPITVAFALGAGLLLRHTVERDTS